MDQGKTGRPKFTIKDVDLAKVEEGASRGLTYELLGGLCGIKKDTWIKLRKDHPEIEDAINRGRAKMVYEVGGKLYEKAKAGDTIASIFIMKAYGGARENASLEISGPNGGPVEVNDVKAKLMGDLLRKPKDGAYEQ